jgi:CheY-like chemotaxis protein/nitrogen-specific signal transduction histidine kinase
MADTPAFQGEPVSILVVDDNAENRLTLESILKEPGQDVVTAASGRDALRHLLHQEFAVILLDVNMPVMDGFETAALVRQRKSSERTPIIFITAFSDEVHISRGYSLGAVDYIVSPVVPEVLRSKVAVFVDLFRKTEQIRLQAESLRRRADQLYQLSEASLAVNSANALDEILEIVTETARDLVAARCALTVTKLERENAPAHRPVAFAADPTDGAANASGGGGGAATGAAGEAAAAQERERLIAQGEAVTAGLADQGRAVVLRRSQMAGDARWRLAAGDDAAADAAWLAAPLTGRDGRCIGWVHLVGQPGAEFGDDDRTIVTQLSQVASVAIENLLSSEAREANRLKDEFLTTLSHELRTPLTAILGWTRVLRTSRPEAARFAHGLEVIERNVTAQTKLIEDLLDVSRIIAGKLRVSLRPIAVLAPIEAAVEVMRPAAEAKGVDLRLSIGPEVEAGLAIAGDAERLQQVGWNLLSNAIKFTPPGGRIEVSASRQADWFKVAVRDSGKGISPQFLGHVFDRFRQDDSSSTRAHGGLGIGLAIVRHIVELHGGKVEGESGGAQLGATFTVSLPLLSAGVAIAAPPHEAQSMTDEARQAEGPAEAALAGIEILVVDDEPDTREILGEVLRGAGATVATAASLAATLEYFDRRCPDLLVSDIAMPGGDGYALMRQLRRRTVQRGGRVPAIAVSAHAREEDRQRALAAGFGRYITKPVEPADLLAAVREMVTPEGAGGGGNGRRGKPRGGGEGNEDGDRGDRGERGGERSGGERGEGPAAGQGGDSAESEVVPGRRILLVEDDPDTRDALKTLLELSGYQVAVAADGSEAVAHAVANRPEVALVDIGLPEIDGNEVARRIRAELGADGIFLVALTGYGGEAEVERSRAAGFDAHFTKPVELARLDRLLREGGRTGS